MEAAIVQFHETANRGVAASAHQF